LTPYKAESILRKHPLGAQAEAWFDPKHPKYAILERSKGAVQKGYLILVGGIAIILTLILFLGRRRQRPFPAQGK
jgi:hypothetical protein